MKNRMTPREVAQELGVGRLYVYELLASGLLKGRQVMGRWLIRGAEVKRYRRTHPRVGRTIEVRQKHSHPRPADIGQTQVQNAVSSAVM